MSDTGHAETVRLYITQIDMRLDLPGPTGIAIIRGAKFSGAMRSSPILYYPERRFIPPELPEHIRDLIKTEQVFIIVPHNVDAVYDDAARMGGRPELSLLSLSVTAVWQKIQLVQEYLVARKSGDSQIDL